MRSAQEVTGETEVIIVASAQLALEAAAKKSRELGVPAYILSDAIQGESRQVAKLHAELARQIVLHGQPFAVPCVLLSGGETTVTVRGSGCGGRNVEFLASLAQSLEGLPGVYALAADTDGVDGALEIAGAFTDPTIFERAGSRLDRALSENDAHTLFEALGDQIIPGPTFTNVNDFRALFVTT